MIKIPQSSGNGPSSVAKLETKLVADILAENPDAYKQPPVPSQTPPNPDS